MNNKALWLKNPMAILTPEGVDARGGIVIQDGKLIAHIGLGKIPDIECDVFDASEHVVLPGLINSHHHFYQTLTRAHPAAINKELFPWLTSLYPIWTRLTPDALALATEVALAELMMSGVTCTSDHHYVYPDGLDDAMDIQAEKAGNLGVRMVLNRGSMNLSVKDGGLPPENIVQDADTILADCERVISKYHSTADGAMVQVALAPCSPFSVTKELMQDTVTLAEKHNCTLHTHLAETEDENTFCLETMGCRPLDYLEETGWLTDKTWLAHGIFFNDDEVKRLGKAGTGISHCPTANMILGSGQCRTRELENAGVKLGLGVDGSASSDSSNLMEVVRYALMLSRLTYDATVSHFDALRWATEGSAQCFRRNDIGALDVGKQADIAMFKLDELRFSGAHDPIAALILCGAHRADRVMIAGKWTVEDGNPVGVDVAKLRADHGQAAKKFN